MEDGIDDLIYNEDYLMLRELHLRQQRRQNAPLSIEGPSFVNREGMRPYQSNIDKTEGDHEERHLPGRKEEENCNILPNNLQNIILEENEDIVGDDKKDEETEESQSLTSNVSQRDTLNYHFPTDAAHNEDVNSQTESHLLDDFDGYEQAHHNADFAGNIQESDQFDIADIEILDHHIPNTYSFYHDIKTKGYDDKLHDADWIKDRGNIRPIGYNLSEAKLKWMLDVGAKVPLERFQHDRSILPDALPKNGELLLPKNRALIIAESGHRSACLYESFVEWLLDSSDKPKIAPLCDYYKEWFNFKTIDCQNKKLSHNVGRRTNLALQLKDAVQQELHDNADTLLETFENEFAGEGYESVQSLRDACIQKQSKDCMGGLAEIIMFSIMARTPVMIWEHSDEFHFQHSSLITAGTDYFDRFIVHDAHKIQNPNNIIIHLLYDRRLSEGLSHYEVLVVFDI